MSILRELIKGKKRRSFLNLSEAVDYTRLYLDIDQELSNLIEGTRFKHKEPSYYTKDDLIIANRLKSLLEGKEYVTYVTNIDDGNDPMVLI